MSEAYAVPSTPNLANVTASASAVTVAGANPARRGLIVFNDADVAVLLKFGSAASATSFTDKVAAGAVWYMEGPIYNGIVTGIWVSSPTGSARVTELT